jgi:hypothetical protein
VAVFSLLMAAVSSIAGSFAAVILKISLQYFNPGVSFKKAILISCITALAQVVLLYMLFYALLKDLMTLYYMETFIFWFLFPAVTFCTVYIIGGSKINTILRIEVKEVNNSTNKVMI